jgi:endo-1,4-beta-xylanase
MSISASCRQLSSWILISTVLSLPAAAADPLADADARIEKHRKADATVVVVDSAGKPIAGAEVKIEQKRHEFLFGSNIFSWGRFPDEKLERAYRDRFAELLNYATVGFYWPFYEPQRGRPNHQYAEQVARWCKEHDIRVKGHPLAWNDIDSPWFPEDSQELYQLQLARINDCVKRFAGLIDYWDVVNEATQFERPDFQKRSPKHTAMWKQVGRIPFVKECFAHARAANPKATLLINDYVVDPSYQRLIEQLVDDQGKRIYDAIGIQSHMHGGAWPTDKTWEGLERFARLGVPLHFTETTILSGQREFEHQGDWPSTPEGEAYQAREVARFYTLLFSHPAVQAITWWDFSDLGSWKNAPSGLLRKDMTPKPAYEELKRLIKGKWWTAAQLRTGADGSAALRGFLGNYTITVSAAGKQPVKKDVSLTKGETNRWTITLP